MRKALIHGKRVLQIEDSEFPVAPPLAWIECEDSVTTWHTFDGARFITPQPSDLHEWTGAAWEIPEDKQVVAQKREALRRIAFLEASITERRKREAILTQAGKDWMSAVEVQISAERAKLK